jgi:multidrug efflux system outer membrane protein
LCIILASQPFTQAPFPLHFGTHLASLLFVFQLRSLDLQLEISRRTLASRQDSLKVTQTLANGGATSMLDVRQAEQLVSTAAETIPDPERQIEQQENFLSTLLGNNPGPIARGMKLTEQPHPSDVSAGLPSRLDWLRRET